MNLRPPPALGSLGRGKATDEVSWTRQPVAPVRSRCRRRSARTASVLTRVVKLALLFSAALVPAACKETARVARLEIRVDSLAVALTEVIRQLDTPHAQDTVSAPISMSLSGGSDSAAVIVIEYTDYECPFCKRHDAAVLPVLWRKYVATGKVRYLVKDLPLPMHPHAITAALLGRCIYEQDPARYWVFRHRVFAAPSLTDSLLLELATEYAADRRALLACRQQPRIRDAVAQNQAEASSLRFHGTPSFIVGRTDGGGVVRGLAIRGAYPEEIFIRAIDYALDSTR